MSGFLFLSKGVPDMDALNKATREWELKAARGECGWVCADCSMSFSAGMPNECAHGHAACTELIERDKAEAAAAIATREAAK